MSSNFIRIIVKFDLILKIIYYIIILTVYIKWKAVNFQEQKNI